MSMAARRGSRRLQVAVAGPELIELDELGALIPGWVSVSASGSAAQSSAAAIETVELADSDIPINDRDSQAVETIAGAAD